MAAVSNIVNKEVVNESGDKTGGGGLFS